MYLNSEKNDNRIRKLKSDIKSIAELLSISNLVIPDYQRPYKWTEKNIRQLFKDIETFKDKNSYRLGTIVFHEDTNGSKEKILNIVDGQQRIITLYLIIKVLLDEREKCLYVTPKQNFNNFEKNLSKLYTSLSKNDISIANLRKNYQEVYSTVVPNSFTKQHIDFLLNKCEVVVFTLTNLSEAFQFFDSQNARGKDLVPHDLLKAYHLREFSAKDSELKKETVESWENSNSNELANLFSTYLYRIRNWLNGQSARKFTKNEIDLFKGVNLEKQSIYPYVKSMLMIDSFIEEHRRRYETDKFCSLEYPFTLDQTIINGRRFFEMVRHYQNLLKNYKSSHCELHQNFDSSEMTHMASNILITINNYEGCYRTGDLYVRSMFHCLLFYYIDKFGFKEIGRAIEKIFVWAYSLRLNYQRVGSPSVDNYVLSNNLFKVIRKAASHTEFINYPLLPIEKIFSCDKLEKLFIDMGYLKEKVQKS